MYMKLLRDDVVQWVTRVTRNLEIIGSSPSTDYRCFIEQEPLPLLLSTGWLFRERVRA